MRKSLASWSYEGKTVLEKSEVKLLIREGVCSHVSAGGQEMKDFFFFKLYFISLFSEQKQVKQVFLGNKRTMVIPPN